MQNVILQPIEVGGQTFKNRIMFPPLTTGYEKNGMISEQDMGFYTRLAKGGVGYIVLGDVAPINSFSPTPKLFDDSQIPAFKELADSVHAYGTKLGVQLFHPEYDVDAINSLFMQKKFDEMRQRLHHDMMFFTDEVSEEMLMAIIDKMCACAVRAQKAGVDVIQIHGDRLNGCLCSTRMNHRTDKFGGSLENRVRFARMLTRAIRKAVPDMIIDYKLSIVTPQRGKGGIDEADAVQFAQWLVEDGVDMFHVAQANHTGNMADTIPPMGVQPYGFFVRIAGDIKKAVNVPVSAVGRIVDAEMAERVIESGMADIVAMGREYLFWNSVFFVPLGALIVWRYSIQGLGFSSLAMLAGVAEMVARTAVAIVLVPVLGYFGAELSNPAAWIAACLFLYPAYRWTCRQLDNRLLAARLHIRGDHAETVL